MCKDESNRTCVPFKGMKREHFFFNLLIIEKKMALVATNTMVYQSKAVLAAIQRDLQRFAKIQAWWRAHLSALRFHAKRQCVVQIQRAFRRRDLSKMLGHVQTLGRQHKNKVVHLGAVLTGIRDQLSCPITQDLTRVPTLNLRDGYVYEHEAIHHWVRHRSTSPMTRAFTLPWHLVNFREAHAMFESMRDCIYGHDFRCPRCGMVEFSCDSNHHSPGIILSPRALWLRCEHHMITDCLA